MGSHAGARPFWLPLGNLPVSGRFDGPLGAEIPRPTLGEGFVGSQRQDTSISNTLCRPQPRPNDGNTPLPTHQFQA